jgi:hypothetical protein
MPSEPGLRRHFSNDRVNALDKRQQLAALAVAILASFGWMYTRYEQEKSDRAKATLEAIPDQMYGQRIADTFRSLQLLSGYCVDTLQTPSDRPFNAAELAVRLDKMTADVAPGTRASVTHGEAADQFSMPNLIRGRGECGHRSGRGSTSCG